MPSTCSGGTHHANRALCRHNWEVGCGVCTSDNSDLHCDGTLPRLVQDPATIVPASLYILDLVNGTIEYDVIRSPGIDFDVVETFGAFDERCPQPDNFTLLRCTGHQHIGTKPPCILVVHLRSL